MELMSCVVGGDGEWLELELVRVPTSCLFRVQVDGDDQTVQTQDFGEDENQNHTDEQSGLLGRTADTGVTDDADGETGGQTREADSQTST